MPVTRRSPLFKAALAGLLVLALLAVARGSARAQQGPQPRVIGGLPAAPGQFPWMAGLLFASIPDPFLAQYCGGSLIAPTWVLTAAHCVDFLAGPQQLDVLLGRVLLKGPGGERIRAQRIVIHPLFNPDTLDFDVALVQLPRPAAEPALNLISPVTRQLEAPGTVALVMGWGFTLPREFPNELRYAQVQIYPDAVCAGPNAYDGDFHSLTMICAAFFRIDTCQGDSGGPMVVLNPATQRYEQVGITSWGIGCARPDKPGVYTRVSTMLDFIERVTGLAPPSCLPPTPGARRGAVIVWGIAGSVPADDTSCP